MTLVVSVKAWTFLGYKKRFNLESRLWGFNITIHITLTMDEKFYTCKNCGAEFPSKEIRLYCKVCKSNLDKSGNLPKL